MGAERAILIVDDIESVARLLARMLGSVAPVVIASSKAEAMRHLAERSEWLAFVFDENLSGDSGLDILSHARIAHPTTPALIVTSELEPAIVNRAYMLGAAYLCKPFLREQILAFAEKIARSRDEEAPPPSTGSALALAIARWKLSPRESDILRAAIEGLSREDIMAKLGIAEGTYKQHVRSLLRKTDALRLDQLAADVLRSALDRGPRSKP